MPGTATTVFTATGVDRGTATKLLEVTFTGVVGVLSVPPTRAVASAGIALPKGTRALGLYLRLTNAIGGPAGDDVYGAIELLMPAYTANDWVQVVTTEEIAFNADGSLTNIGVGCLYGSPQGPSTESGILTGPAPLLTAANARTLPMGAALQVRIGIDVLHVGAASGSANFVGELWALPVGGP